MDSLTHHGVIGMRWGHHKIRQTIQNETNFRNKLTALNGNKSLKGTSDASRFAYRNRNISTRFARIAARNMTHQLIKDALTGKLPTDKKEIATRVAKIAAISAKDMVIQDRLAESAANRYTDNGKRKLGTTKSKFVTREDTIELGLKIAPAIASLGKWTLTTNARRVIEQRAKNEAAFNRWGGKILEEKFATIHDL